MRVLVACEFSGVVRDAFRARGHQAWSCDLLATEREGPHIFGDVLEVMTWGWDMMVAHPPCTALCRAGDRWYRESPARQEAVAQQIALDNSDCIMPSDLIACQEHHNRPNDFARTQPEL